jgi:SAM-dependent methyltransferase
VRTGCGCDDFASIFDRRTAEKDRDRYHQKGPDRTTHLLLQMLRPYGVVGATILDVGGGIGIIDQELLRDGAAGAILVDASAAYLEIARAEAGRTRTRDRLDIVEGDFTSRASEVGAADIVTLDRVICCYPNVDALVSLSASRARRVYGIVLPRDRLLFRLAVPLLNLGMRLRRKRYRAFAHPNAHVDRLVAAAGLRRRAERATFFWRIAVYDRRPPKLDGSLLRS